MNEKAAETRTEPCSAYCPISWVFKAACEVKDCLRRQVPEAFWEHRAAARRESLLALRSLIDAAIERSTAQPRKATRIKVE